MSPAPVFSLGAHFQLVLPCFPSLLSWEASHLHSVAPTVWDSKAPTEPLFLSRTFQVLAHSLLLSASPSPRQAKAEQFRALKLPKGYRIFASSLLVRRFLGRYIIFGHCYNLALHTLTWLPSSENSGFLVFLNENQIGYVGSPRVLEGYSSEVYKLVNWNIVHMEQKL